MMIIVKKNKGSASMQADILKKIDVLVEMAGASVNIDTLQAELKEIEKESSRLKNELSLLTNHVENKYFKSSDKLVDENIKVSLEAKIKKQNKSIKDLENQIATATKEEEDLHTSILYLKHELDSSNEYIDSLEDRINSLKEKEAKGNYKSVLEEEKHKKKENESLIAEKEKTHTELLEKLNYLTLAKDEMAAKLESDEKRLSEIKSSLMNPSSYVDEDLKEIDRKRTEEIQKQLSSLDKRRIEIITDPGIIASEAKELIDEDDRTSALSKIKELVTIVKSKPFMDIPNSADLSRILQDELDTASTNRDEFAALIDSKDYTGKDSKIVTNRIEYLNIEIANTEDKIRLLKEEINRLDTTDFQELSNRLEEAQDLALELEKNIDDYEQVMASEEEKTPKRRAVLSAAFEKKKKDLATVKQIISSYKKNQKELIHKASELEKKDIPAYEKYIRELQEEISLLTKLTSNTSKTKDVLAIESDKRKLKELDEMVKSVKHRQKYTTTPNEIFDEIEMYLGTIDVDDEPTQKVNEEEELVTDPIDIDYDLEDSLMNDLNNLEEIDDTPVITEPVDNLPTFEDEVMQELPDFDIEMANEEPKSERLKVVAVEPIADTKSKEPEENPFLVADYQDDDYTDVDQLFSDGVL